MGPPAPRCVGIWLERKCAMEGVDIRTSTTVTGVESAENGTLRNVQCSILATGESYSLPCQKLVIAAGPWSPSLIQSLYPNSTLDLQPSINAADWIVFQNLNPVTADTTSAVFFDDIVHEKLEYAGRNNGSIFVCGRRNFTATLPPPGKEDEPDKKVLSDLIQYSRRFIHQDIEGGACPALPILEKGRAFRPSTITGLPLISEIPPEKLSGVESEIPTGVFLCYGHGSYGMTLGMGSGKLMAQVILGLKPDIDISKFTLS
ncbi:hypothetical protein DL770_002853 [Monosporascus sp. CRB-9-2]|nr:hypothetical protein DL770_002853 [Monosporascus sp. CRB-9-2]